ncbi:hypothetical protein HPP92_026167 [Vanilla planifolia]|uniref:EF-hand domain-containing protein n=1 Tax=Vanilla planifolia TaxID=51239 RepID=A0A835U9X1_VANPL|nr:hypothetical protein HPP92_026383 [Vanilla planifolia]KAG0451649.1 hypothetical protein HPP92_026167 [Vanilla planifolia]
MAAVRPQNMEAYESYFRRADLDQDGRISGSEAVAFFRDLIYRTTSLLRCRHPSFTLLSCAAFISHGIAFVALSSLSKYLMIWKHADQKNSGFLGRPEFYNALRLVTVAQSGRELTPDIVNAALNGPAAAKIPAPRINLIAHPTAQTSSSGNPRPPVASSLPASIQIPISTPTLSQTSGLRGISVGTFPGQGMNQQFITPSSSHLMGPPQMVPTSVSPVGQGISQAQSGPANLSVLRPTSNSARPSTDWLGTNSGVSVGGLSQEPVNGISSPKNQNGKDLTVARAIGGLTPKTLEPLGSVTLSSTNSLDAKDSRLWL